MTTLENFLESLSPEQRAKINARSVELIEEHDAYNKAFDFFFNLIQDNDLTPEEIQEGRETAPTVLELASAIHVAVHHGHTLEEAFENALVIIKHWGKLGQDDYELPYRGAIETLAAEEELVEGMVSERADFSMVVSTVADWIKIGPEDKPEFNVIEAGLRVLYEYHLWDLGGEADEVEAKAEGT